jgi:hypothetical protein
MQSSCRYPQLVSSDRPCSMIRLFWLLTLVGLFFGALGLFYLMLQRAPLIVLLLWSIGLILLVTTAYYAARRRSPVTAILLYVALLIASVVWSSDLSVGAVAQRFMGVLVLILACILVLLTEPHGTSTGVIYIVLWLAIIGITAGRRSIE